MPMLDLSEDDVELLELAKRVGGRSAIDLGLRAKTLHDKLYNGKDTSADYEAILKKALPDIRTTRDIAEPIVAPIMSRLEAMEARFKSEDEARSKAQEDSLQRDFDSRWNDVVKTRSLTEEGQEKLIGFMKDRKLADPEAAAALYFERNPAPAAPITPTSIAPNTWSRDMGITHDTDDKSAELLLKNPDQWAAEEAAAVLTEMRRGGTF